MKYLPYLLLILVIATVNCRGYSTTGEELQGSDFIADPEPHYSQDNSVMDDGSSMGPTSTNGVSQDNGRNLVLDESVKILGNVQKRFLTGCPLDKGFFGFVDTSQCFKLMTDYKDLNWAQGKALCEEQKLKLAHPYNPISVRRYIVERYGAKQAYVDAKANGKTFIWQDNDEVIDNNSPLWIGQSPALGKCLILQYTNLATQPNQPYWPTDCKTANDFRFPLCELVLE